MLKMCLINTNFVKNLLYHGMHGCYNAKVFFKVQTHFYNAFMECKMKKMPRRICKAYNNLSSVAVNGFV